MLSLCFSLEGILVISSTAALGKASDEESMASELKDLATHLQSEAVAKAKVLSDQNVFFEESMVGLEKKCADNVLISSRLSRTYSSFCSEALPILGASEDWISSIEHQLISLERELRHLSGALPLEN